MSPNNRVDGDLPMPELEDLESSPRKIPSISSLFHILWHRKWIAFGLWLILAIPAGVILSIFDLPRSYTTATVMRFPQVVGAQTNVMRDVAITDGQSIITIFNSYQVLDAAIRKLGLRLRITTPELFRRDVFKEIHPGENLGEGRYEIVLERNGTTATITYRPIKVTSEYTLYSGPVDKDGRISIPGLDLTFTSKFLLGASGKKVQLEMSPLEETFQDLRKSMTPRALGGGTNFEIRLKDRDPFLVADILNTLREQFLEVYYGTTEVQDVGILVQMEKDLALAKDRLEKSQDEVSRYYADHPELSQFNAGQPANDLAYLQARQQIEMLEQRKLRVVNVYAAKEPDAGSEKKFFWANELLSAMSEANEAKSNILRSSLYEVNNRQVEFLRTLGPDHPKILEAEKEKQVLYTQIDETEAALIRKLDQEIADARLRMAANAPKTAARVSVKVQLELERLNNTNTNNQNIYDRLLEAYNRAKLVTGSEFFKVSVVDLARPAIYKPPSFKNRILIAATAVMMLLFFVPGVVLAWGVLFIKIWTKDDIRRLLNLKTLGIIALREPKKPAGGKGKKREADEEPEARNSRIDPMLLIHGNNSILEDLESFRTIREEIENHFRNPASPGKYCLMVSSCRPHEGKSTCAANLAITFARKGKRTLLVDADFRLGRVANIFNLSVGTGIDTLLDHQSEMSREEFLDAATMVFLPTLQHNLVVAPRKSPKANASELISSDRFKAFIRFAREQFDVVIIDTSPVMITPEPLSLAELADGIVFVCQSGHTSASEARDAVESLGERNNRIAAVLNGVRTSPFEGNRYRRYSYYYSVQPNEREQDG